MWLEVDAPRLLPADQAEQRRLELHAPGNVKQRSAGPEGRVQGREVVGAGKHGLGKQIAFEQLGMVFDRAIQVDEDRTPENGGVGLAARAPRPMCAMPVA